MFESLDNVGHDLKEDAKDAGEWTKEKAHDAKEDVKRAV
jgi:hypothetical protein